MSKRKKILLTGASGTVGYEVLKQLHFKKNLYEIIVLDRETRRAKKKLKDFKNDIHIIYGDISNKEDLLKIDSEIDVAIHLAAIIHPFADENPELAHRVNTLGTEKLIRVLEKTSPRTFFIYSSSISVYGDRLKNPWIEVTDKLAPSIGDEYAKTKIKSERIIQDSKLDWSIFRLAAIMGGLKVSKFMFHQPFATSLEIATPEDTGRAFVNAIEKEKQLSKRIFNLGGGKECQISYENFLKESFKIYGLGKFDFAPKAFAEKNFHCGFYKDGDELNDILDFRKDTLLSFFEKEENKISSFQKGITSLMRRPIKRILESKSDPLIAHKSQDKASMKHFFDSEDEKSLILED